MQFRLNSPYLGVLVLYIFISSWLYKTHYSFANSSFFFATITFVVGSLAFYIYDQQRVDKKRDAARLIIQEIRRAEEIIDNYKQMGGYKFSKKIIATNSWKNNIHFFVGDLDNDELDKISDLYSTGEYLDSLVQDISKITFEYEIENAKRIQQQLALSPIPLMEGQPPQPVEVTLHGLPPVWKARLDFVSKGIEPIYHSTIMSKLKNIANLK